MPKKKTQFEYVLIFNKVHNDKYDYSLFLNDNFILKGSDQKIPIICPIHGTWDTTSIDKHRDGRGCPKCGHIKRWEKRRKQKEYYLSKFRKVHGDRYDYSLFEDDKFIFVNSVQIIPIRCKLHGVWETTTINGHCAGNGCTRCGEINSKKQNRPKEYYLSKFRKVHGDNYNYSLFEDDNFILVNSNQTIPIICKIHGQWDTTKISSHCSGVKCPKCSYINSNNHKKRQKEFFLSKFRKVHDDKYDYSLFEDDNFILEGVYQKIPIICKIHGMWDTTTIDGHTQGTGCTKCKLSKGELKIEKLLKKNNIQYITQKKFKDCIDKRQLPFDFYLSELNICIEYDGVQHFEQMRYSKNKQTNIDKFNAVQLRDQIKTKYCEDNGIKLLRIRYDENIEEKLNEFLKINSLSIAY